SRSPEARIQRIPAIGRVRLLLIAAPQECVAMSIQLTVTDVIEETADARSLLFALPEHFAYRPGQFLTLRVPSDTTGSVARCYSLCSAPHEAGPLRVTVKRTATGYASNWLCDNAAAGMELDVLVPAGVFTPKSLDEDLLLF